MNDNETTTVAAELAAADPLARRIAEAHQRIALQDDPALQQALGDDEIEAERKLAKWERKTDRKIRRRTKAAELDEVKREHKDIRWHRRAQGARRRMASADANLAQLYRHASWSARALIAVVVIGMVWSGINVQHNLVPSGDMADPLYWLSYGLEAMISVPIIVIMVVSTNAARNGEEIDRGQVVFLELALMGVTVGLNVIPRMVAADGARAAEYAVAPIMVGVVIWLHSWVSTRYGQLIEKAGARADAAAAAELAAAPAAPVHHPAYRVDTAPEGGHSPMPATEYAPAALTAGAAAPAQGAHSAPQSAPQGAHTAPEAGESAPERAPQGAHSAGSGVESAPEGAHTAPTDAHPAPEGPRTAHPAAEPVAEPAPIAPAPAPAQSAPDFGQPVGDTEGAASEHSAETWDTAYRIHERGLSGLPVAQLGDIVALADAGVTPDAMAASLGLPVARVVTAVEAARAVRTPGSNRPETGGVRTERAESAAPVAVEGAHSAGESTPQGAHSAGADEGEGAHSAPESAPEGAHTAAEGAQSALGVALAETERAPESAPAAVEGAESAPADWSAQDAHAPEGGRWADLVAEIQARRPRMSTPPEKIAAVLEAAADPKHADGLKATAIADATKVHRNTVRTIVELADEIRQEAGGAKVVELHRR
ncbi:hypothetical protein [Nocardia nova]